MKETQGIVTMKNYGGHSMLKFSQLGKDGKPRNETYKPSKEHQEKIDKKLAACRNSMSKVLPKMMAKIEKLKKPSDRIEMYRFTIAIERDQIKELETYQKEFLVMLPPPLTESDQQVTKFLISHHKSRITQLEKAITNEIIKKKL